MADTIAKNLIDAVRDLAHQLMGAAEDYNPLMDLIGDARFVLLGEASHGTHEFYEQRMDLTSTACIPPSKPS